MESILTHFFNFFKNERNQLFWYFVSSTTNKDEIKDEEELRKILKDIFQLLVFNDLKVYFLLDTQRPVQNLFFWCLLFDRIEIAKIFWKMGDVSV